MWRLKTEPEVAFVPDHEAVWLLETSDSSAHEHLTGGQVLTTVTGSRWEAACLAVALIDVRSAAVWFPDSLDASCVECSSVGRPPAP